MAHDCYACETKAFFKAIDSFTSGYEDIADIFVLCFNVEVLAFLWKKAWNYKRYFFIYILEYFCFLLTFSMNVYVYFFSLLVVVKANKD